MLVHNHPATHQAHPVGPWVQAPHRRPGSHHPLLRHYLGESQNPKWLTCNQNIYNLQIGCDSMVLIFVYIVVLIVHSCLNTTGYIMVNKQKQSGLQPVYRHFAIDLAQFDSQHCGKIRSSRQLKNRWDVQWPPTQPAQPCQLGGEFRPSPWLFKMYQENEETI